MIAAIYFAVCYPLSQLLLWLERRVRAGAPLIARALAGRRLPQEPARTARRQERVGMSALESRSASRA